MAEVSVCRPTTVPPCSCEKRPIKYQSILLHLNHASQLGHSLSSVLWTPQSVCISLMLNVWACVCVCAHAPAVSQVYSVVSLSALWHWEGRDSDLSPIGSCAVPGCAASSPQSAFVCVCVCVWDTSSLAVNVCGQNGSKCHTTWNYFTYM